jgi:uncharacterized protein YijF (DUF1287 family)
MRGKEGKDGNPLNEVRMIANSIMNASGAFTADKTIKYDPARSVLKYKPGDKLSLTSGGCTRLAAAFFTEIERKYVAT